MAKTIRTRLVFFAKIGFSALLLWFVLSKLDLHGIMARLRTANLNWLALSIGASPLVIGLSARRWQVLSQGLLTFSQAFRYTWIGLFFGSVFPGMISGDVAKGFALAAKNTRARDERLPVSIFFDKLIGLWALLAVFCMVAIVLLAIRPEALAGLHGVMLVGFAGLAAGLAAGAAVLHPVGSNYARQFARKLPNATVRASTQRILDAVAEYGSRPSLIGQALGLSVAIHLLNSLIFWFLLQSLAIPASPWFAAAIYPLLSLLLALPISVSGIGVRDIFLVTLFKVFGLNPESAAAFSWLLLGLSLPTVAVGALIQLWEVFRK